MNYNFNSAIGLEIRWSAILVTLFFFSLACPAAQADGGLTRLLRNLFPRFLNSDPWLRRRSQHLLQHGNVFGLYRGLNSKWSLSSDRPLPFTAEAPDASSDVSLG